MLQKDTFDFLRALAQNNNREWFNANKAWYERAREDVEQLAAQLIQSVSAFEPDMKMLNPKKCLFRIYRDTRFSSDKSPYKTNFGIAMRAPGAPRIGGYYLHISPGDCFLSCGHYQLPMESIKKMRKGIYNDFDTLREILNDKEFKRELGDLCRDDADNLQRVPNGFDKDHPSAEYLKLKHYYVYKNVTEAQLLDKNFSAYATRIYKLMYPLSRFLDDILLEE